MEEVGTLVMVPELDPGGGPGTVRVQQQAPVDLRLPADQHYLPVVRAVATRVAMVADCSVDDVSDFALAVDEVCASLLPCAQPGTALSCRFDINDDRACVEVTVVAQNGTLPPEDSLGMQILATLADSVHTGAAHEGPTDDGPGNWLVTTTVIKRRGSVGR